MPPNNGGRKGVHVPDNNDNNDSYRNDDEHQIRQLIARWMSATRAGDIDTVLTLMSDDVVFLTPGRPPMVGKQSFAAAATQPPNAPRPQFDATSEIQEIRILGDWAYLWTKLSVTITPPGAPTPLRRAGHTLSILKKQNGHWLLTRDANMLAPA
jgi:uncharacterized protein (TIGR02246 family)